MNDLLSRIPPSKHLNYLIAGGCAFLMAVALYMEHVMALEPCPLCLLQRAAVIAVGLVALVAAVHAPGRLGIRVYAGLAGFAGLCGAGLAARQVWLQSLPADQVPACGPGLDYLLEVFSFTEVLAMVLQGDGSCAEVVWRFAGLSIPGWTLVGFLGLVALAGFQALRPRV